MLSVSFRTLARDVHIHCPDRATADVLAYIAGNPQIEGAAPSRVDLDIEPVHGFLRLVTPDGLLVEGSAAAILDALYAMRFGMVRAECADALFAAGATLTTEAGHVLLVGEPGAGKSTLLVHLADLGWPVSGDQHLIVQDRGATPFPNTLRVWSGALPYLSARAAGIVRGSPRLAGWFDHPTYAVDQSVFGTPWKIRCLDLLHVVVMRANHGGRSSLQPLDRTLAMEAVLQDVLLPNSGQARSLGALRGLISSAHCWELSNGRLDDTRRLLQGLNGLEHQGRSAEAQDAGR